MTEEEVEEALSLLHLRCDHCLKKINDLWKLIQEELIPIAQQTESITTKLFNDEMKQNA